NSSRFSNLGFLDKEDAALPAGTLAPDLRISRLSWRSQARIYLPLAALFQGFSLLCCFPHECARGQDATAVRPPVGGRTRGWNRHGGSSIESPFQNTVVPTYLPPLSVR
ncbi:unnamed protein product, partial [Sphacelaria rigidula]